MEYIIHVDASTIPTNPGVVGIAFSALVGGERIISWSSGGMGTSNYGEVLAIAFALEVLKPGKSDDVLIVTDSQYAQSLVLRCWPSGSNRQVADAVISLMVGMRGVQVDRVLGHRGVQGNEMADFASHQAGIQGAKDPLALVYLPPVPALHDLRILESRIMPKVHLLKRELRDRVLSLHQSVFRGKRKLALSDGPLIRDARRALGLEEAIP